MVARKDPRVEPEDDEEPTMEHVRRCVGVMLETSRRSIETSEQLAREARRERPSQRKIAAVKQPHVSSVHAHPSSTILPPRPAPQSPASVAASDLTGKYRQLKDRF